MLHIYIYVYNYIFVHRYIRTCIYTYIDIYVHVYIEIPGNIQHLHCGYYKQSRHVVASLPNGWITYQQSRDVVESTHPFPFHFEMFIARNSTIKI